MGKKIFLFIIGCLLFLQVKADKLYFENATINPGSTIDLPILIQNTDPVAGFQFHLSLPEGITVLSARLSENRLPEGATVSNFLYDNNTVNGEYRFAGALNVTKDNAKLPFIGNDGEVAYLTIAASADIALGTYTMTVSDVVISDQIGNAKHIDGCTFELTVANKIYDTGYAVEIEPFELNNEDGVKADVNLIIDSSANPEMTMMGTISFDNKAFEDYNLYQISPSRGSSLSYYDHEFSLVNNTWAAAGDKKKLATMTFYPSSEDGSFSLASGIYTITINLIVKVENKILTMVPYTADIYVDSPKAKITDGTIAYHGNYSSTVSMDLLKASMAGVSGYSVVDLTAVTAVPENTALTLTNDNALIKASTALTLTNNNVVVNDVCEKLVIADGSTFVAPWTFTATEAQYSRSLNDQHWGTLYLPFAVESTSNVKYYALKSVTTTTDGVMRFTEQDHVDALTPCVFYVESGDCDIVSNEVEVPVTNDYCAKNTDVEGWTLNGTLNVIKKNMKEGGENYGENIYYISQDKFWKATGKLTINPFRAFFQSTGAAGASYRIVTDEAGIDSIEADINLESGHLYDLKGREVKNMQKGEIYLLNGMKVMFE